jgi:hypothetical protein
VVVVLLATNVFFATRLIQVTGVAEEAQAAAQSSQSHRQEIAFLQLFIKHVLQTDGEIDFETRLQLENQVRALGDAEILGVWKQFVESTNPEEAQAAVGQLLILLVEAL